MIKTKVTVEMSPQLKRNLSATYLVGVPLRDYLQEATETVRDIAKEEAPEDLGELRKSHVALVDNAALPAWGRMEVRAVSKDGAPYPIFVHEGTKPHFPPVSAIAPWAQRHNINPFVLARSIAQKGTKPNPWLERAVDKALPKLRDLGGLAGAIKKQWSKP
jgi:hypothetical protein